MDYPDNDRVVAVLADMLNRVQSIAEFEQRSMLVFDESDAMDQLKGLKRWPAAVVQYEGMRSNRNPTREIHSTSQIGNGVIISVAVMVINQGETIVKTDTKIPTLLLLTALRRTLLNQVSPSGHKWSFMVEAPAVSKNGLTFWIQRWQTPLLLQIN